MSTTMKAQFNALLDPPGDLSLEGEGFSGYTLFVVLFHVICFFFMVNFLLAIIVDAYGDVQKLNAENVVEQDVVSDLYSLVRTGILSYRHGWPSRKHIIHQLKSLGMTYVNVPDLMLADFRSEASARAFFNHYYWSYNFLCYDPKEGMPASIDDVAAVCSQLAVNLKRSQRRMEYRFEQLERKLNMMPSARSSNGVIARESSALNHTPENLETETGAVVETPSFWCSPQVSPRSVRSGRS
eukprot:gnl/TRDRNA2_/TRDRNA2_162019_c0_seq4.p1 gnl/TRDRNA2_/TRDRNA2_162019_c0~~gnl/TRDRNA2_/TRDRNA2_162019_c0_seq4.p1  ORF type:complete len:262 (+),score=32.75 gnl/TRDRNA2_/TRDRNA2_162019_c0_seq4:68-787(+)